MRQLKTMGLFVALALTLGAVSAAGASASYFSFDEYPAWGSGEPSGPHSIHVPGGKKVECEASPFDVEASGPAETLDPGSAPADAECNGGWAPFQGTMEMNDCRFIYHVGAETGPGRYDGTVEIGPAGCGPITMNAYCEASIPAQTGIAAEYRNEGEGAGASLTVSVAGSIEYVSEKVDFFSCGKSGAQTRTYVGDWELTAENEGEEPIGSLVTALPVSPLYLSGEASEIESQQPKFEAGAYPTTLAGEQSESDPHVFTIAGGRKVECDAVDFGGPIAQAGPDLEMQVDYQGCTATILGNSFPAEVEANSCGYVLSAENAGPPYTGELGVACDEEGDAVEFRIYNGETHVCTWEVAAQDGLAGIALANVGSGIQRAVEADFGLSGIAYTRTKGGLAVCGPANSNATYGGTSTLRALYEE